MSSRQLRRLQKQRELEELQAKNPATHSSEESEDESPALQKPKASLFSGFAALGGQDEQEDESDEREDKSEIDEPAAAPAAVSPIPETRKNTPKKNKKKKKKSKKQDASESKPDTAPQEGSDEIDRAILELTLSEKTAGGATASAAANSEAQAYERICELLKINTYHLKVMNEMRNLFGREAIAHAQHEENEERLRAQRTRQLQQQVDLETYLKAHPGKALPEVTIRRNPFLAGKDTWPRASTEGLTMKQLKGADKHGAVEFGFAHDANYNKLEEAFFSLVQMYDPMQLVHFLYRHPYHVSSLIQVSKVAKQDQNSALCGDLCERALFTFGRVSLSAYRQKLYEGKARLEFSRPENRQFWLAGYHYLKSLVLKGTYRTALEWSKLLLSMDLSDPYGIIHFIHPMAIRAHESKWFIDFCDSEALDQCDTAQDYIRQTLVLARLQQQDTAGAKALLLEGMERLPWLYSSLFKALGFDVPKAIWGMQPRDQHEELFTELYVYQTKGLWENAQAASLLKEVGSQAKKPVSQTFAFPPVVGRNLGRFVYLDNTPALMSLVPDGMLSTTPNWDFDPLPPPQEDNLFSYESQKLPWAPHRDAFVGLPGAIPQDRGALRAILERLRQEGGPDLGDAVGLEALDAAVADADDAGGEGGNDGGAQTLNAVFRAFVNMLAPGGGGGGSSRGDDDDGDDSWGDSDLPYGTMPGAWASDSEDDLPGLLPMDGEDEGHEDEGTTDDDMPPLV